MQRCNRALTLIELPVVILIITVLAGMLMPALGAVRTAARTSQHSSNLRQVGMAIPRMRVAGRCNARPTDVP